MLALLLASAAIVIFLSLVAGYLPSVVLELNVLSVFGVKISVPLVIDYTSLAFSATVLMISASVLYFSKFYMSKEKHFLRFHLLVCAFIFSMLMLIFSPNLVSLILGWDGLGVTSFLLVVYFNSHKSFNAGMLTALTNRIGDCLLLLTMALFMNLAPFSFFLQSSFFSSLLPISLLTLVVSAACTKSAQIPFSAWLPAAMAAPTPVSSLVHSSTLVTAGVYLMLRFHEFLVYPVNKLLFVLGGMTMMMASASALFESDMKKIIALSTLSQLGLMMLGVGMGAPDLAFFHLLTHAFFKAMMFMSIGSIIHLNNGAQDLRITNVASAALGPSLSFLMVSNFSLMGFPYMSGFYSKDLIIEASLMTQITPVEQLIFYASVALSAAYSLRLMLLVSWGSLRFNSLSWIQDCDSTFLWSLSALWCLAIAGGSFLSWALVSPASFVVQGSLKGLVFFSVILGLLLAPSLLSAKSEHAAQVSWSLGSLWALAFLPTLTISPGYYLSKNLFSKMDSAYTLFGLTIFLYATESVSLVTLKAAVSREMGILGFVFMFVLLIY